MPSLSPHVRFSLGEGGVRSLVAASRNGFGERTARAAPRGPGAVAGCHGRDGAGEDGGSSRGAPHRRQGEENFVAIDACCGGFRVVAGGGVGQCHVDDLLVKFGTTCAAMFVVVWGRHWWCWATCTTLMMY